MDVEILDINTIVIVGGNQENDAITSIFKSTDRGQTWNIIRDIPQAPWLLAVDFVDSQTGYAVGEDGLVLKTVDGGDSWTELSLPGNAANRNYNDVVFFDANNGMIVGGNESNDAIRTVLKTTDGGASWSIISDNLGSWIKAVQFPTASVGYACGDGAILKTTDGGSTWNAVNLTGNIANRTYNDIHFLTDQVGVAVGGNRTNDSIQTIIRTVDGGATWSVLKDGLGSWVSALEFSSANKGIIVGDDGVIKFTEDAGAIWQNLQLNVAVNPGEHLFAADFLNDNFGVVAGRYGEVLIFEGGIPNAPTVSISTANLISTDSVVIRGIVNANGDAATVMFEYGMTQALGTSVSAIPGSVSGNDDTEVAALLTGLSSGIYYYRLRAENQGGENISGTGQFYIGDLWSTNNLDFEDWQEYNYTVPEEWDIAGTPTQSNSYDNSVAVQLSGTIDDTISAVILGQVDNGDFLGGFPVAETPDSIVGYFNYNITPGTEGFVLIVLKRNGAQIDLKTFTFTGNSNGQFERLAFAVDYTGSEIPDSVILGFANNNPFSGITSIDNTSSLDNVSLVSVSGATLGVPNGGFEDWSSVTSYQPINWYNEDLNETPYLNNTVERVTDSQNGSYAIKMMNDVSAQRNARIRTGTENYNDPGISVAGLHQTLHGFMKFDMQDMVDTVNIWVAMFDMGQQIGWGNMKYYEPVTEYTAFEIPINYDQQATQADSASITIEMGNSNDMGSSILWIDNLSFDGIIAPFVPLNVDGPIENDQFAETKLYPNPTDGDIWVDGLPDLQEDMFVEVFSVEGRRIITKQVPAVNRLALELRGIKSGIYILRLTYLDSKATLVRRLVKK